ncbi:MAG TPA: hypothetical protein VK277_04860 [Acidimicrobiales bacterium]|nr:hypothetical protein [Acidimicrobiales bacterium]
MPLTYAILLELDRARLGEHYPHRHGAEPYRDIGEFLAERGFTCSEGIYWGDPERIDEVTCVLTVQDLARAFPWFGPCVHSVKLLRLAGQADLMAAVASALSWS